MTNAETWTEIPKIVLIFVQDRIQIVFCIEMSRNPSLIASVPASFVHTVLDHNDDSLVGFKKPP